MYLKIIYDDGSSNLYEGKRLFTRRDHVDVPALGKPEQIYAFYFVLEQLNGEHFEIWVGKSSETKVYIMNNNGKTINSLYYKPPA